MSLIFSNDLPEIIRGKYLYLDNCFLKEIYFTAEYFAEFADLVYGKAFPHIDPLIEFEFTRNTFVKAEVEKREKFISSEIFTPSVYHFENFLKIQNNAMILSKIYTQAKQGQGAGIVDLFLAGRAMWMHAGSTYIITSNVKDFPDCVFDVVGVISMRKPDGTILSSGILEFNQDKFNDAYRKITNLS